MVLELYASGEASEILGMMAKNGFYKQMNFHSTTSQYETLSRGPRIFNQEVRDKMRAFLVKDIKEGAFAQEWKLEQEGGSKTLAKLKQEALDKPMTQAETEVISLVQQAHAL